MKENETDVRLSSVDEAIGRILVNVMEESMSLSGCPSAEDIAVLIDGLAGSSEKSRLLQHLASCSRCYAIFSATVKTAEMHGDERTSNVIHYRKFISFAVKASAIAAVMVLLFYVSPLFTGSETRRIADSLLQNNEEQLARQIRSHAVPSYGFTHAYSESEIAFAVGVRLVDLQLMAENGFEAELEPLLLDISRLLNLNKVTSELAARYRNFSETRMPGKAIRLRKLMKDTENAFTQGGCLRLGAYIEGVRLAAAIEDAAFLREGPHSGKLDTGHCSEMPQHITILLNELIKLLKLKDHSPAGFSRISALSEEIISLI